MRTWFWLTPSQPLYTHSYIALLCPLSSWPSMCCPRRDVLHPPNSTLGTPSYLQPCQRGTGSVNAHSPPGETGASSSTRLSLPGCVRLCLCVSVPEFALETHISTKLTRGLRIRCYHLPLQEEEWYNFQFPVIMYKRSFLCALISPCMAWWRSSAHRSSWAL